MTYDHALLIFVAVPILFAVIGLLTSGEVGFSARASAFPVHLSASERPALTASRSGADLPRSVQGRGGDLWLS